jgi:hypothetical protein
MVSALRIRGYHLYQELGLCLFRGSRIMGRSLFLNVPAAQIAKRACPNLKRLNG